MRRALRPRTPAVRAQPHEPGNIRGVRPLGLLALFAPALGALALSGARCDEPRIDIPQLPPVDLTVLPLPTDDDGKLVLIEVADSRIELDPTANDAITAVGVCTDLISYCVGPGRSLTACVAATPSCTTSTPWTETIPCCPSACHDAFADAVASGREPLAAFEDVFFRAPDCSPGVRAALAGR